MAASGADTHRPSVALLRRLRELADPDGFLPFDRYWEIAQYDPDVGYYAQERSPLGTAGDFYTAPYVGSFFGQTIADRLLVRWRELGRPSPYRFVELGAGDGRLAFDVLERLADHRPEEAEWTYALVERSEPLRHLALERIRPAAERAGITLEAPGSLSDGAPYQGSILANELLDALPHRRLRRTAAGWAELGVLVDGGQVHPGQRALTRIVPGGPLPEMHEGGTLDLSAEAEGLIREAADALVAGSVLFLDYGADEGRWSRSPGDGTVVALREHRPLPDLLSEPGRSDLSAFVNFTRIRAAAGRAALKERYFGRQREALVAWGLPERIEEATRAAATEADRVRLQLQSKQLLVGFENFWALELGAGPEPG
ncbi:MAG TPA: SAM-dependent methyltransferase [Thermoplasmata archaeon]|nr:SAM-dependent methyltransferase [Thermoplasmata archaeon]